MRQCERAANECSRRGVALGVIALSIDGVEDRMVWYPLEEAPLLQAVARRLRAEMRAEFFFSRIGNTFFILLPATDEARTALLGRRLVEDGVAIEVAGARAEVAGCAGAATIAAWKDPLSDLRDAFARSVAALHVARRRGSSSFSMHSAALEKMRTRERRIERGLRSALRDGELLLLYQPIVEIHTRRTVAVEALVRWKHPDFGVVSPCEFVPIAERLGHAAELDHWVLARALEEYPAMAAAVPDLALHVNVSAEHLNVPDAAPALLEAIEASGVAPERIVLEVTESASVNRLETIASNLVEVRRGGVRIAVDDIGTGFNSLAFFVNVPCDAVKVDRGLVPTGQRDEGRLAVLDGIMRACERLGVSIVVEGVETAEQDAVLRSAGVRYAQGFRYAYPAPAARLVEGSPFPT